MKSIKEYRTFFANFVVCNAGSTNERLLSAFAAVERECFLGPGLWQVCAGDDRYLTTPDDDPRLDYQDVMIGLIPERGINSGAPQLHALCLDACNPMPGDFVVHIGAGTGYFTAILANLVGPTGRVRAYEIEPALAARARANLAHLKTAEVLSSAAPTSSLPSADVIYVNAGATHPPPSWLDALKIGGRLVFPLTPHDELGCILLVVRSSETGFAARALTFAKFIPCIGARDDAESAAVRSALKARSAAEVRSLRRDQPPDSTAWCVGDGWWLSTAPP